MLCLLVLLANIFLLLWEYRTGAFSSTTNASEQQVLQGNEPIVLLEELPEESNTLPTVASPKPPLASPDDPLVDQTDGQDKVKINGHSQP